MTTKLAYTLREACEMTGLSQDLIKAAVDKGRLRAKRTSQDDEGRPTGRYLFRTADLEAWLDGLVDG